MSVAEPNLKVGMALEDFVQLYETEGPFELIDGERIAKMPPLIGHVVIVRILYLALCNHVFAEALGEVYSEGPYIPPGTYDANWVTNSRVPDIMFVSKPRIDEYQKNTPDWDKKPLIIVPDLVVEVISKNDRYSEVNEKVQVYLNDGVRLIWVVDPKTQKIAIHLAGSNQQTNLVGDDLLTGGDIVPGFEIKVSEVFKK